VWRLCLNIHGRVVDCPKFNNLIQEYSMPAKFKASAKKYVRGVPASKLPYEHFYLHTMKKEELFEAINNTRTKPKVRQKCLNELAKRKVQVVWVDPSEVQS
jgi:hypothetical protein